MRRPDAERQYSPQKNREPELSFERTFVALQIVWCGSAMVCLGWLVQPIIMAGGSADRADGHECPRGDIMRVLMNLIVAGTLMVGSAMAQAGCFRCAPIYDIVDAPVNSAAGKPLTEEQVKGAILRAGATLGWQMREVGPGKVAATINLRKHQADVEIPYSTKTYSILYKSSVNLDAADGQIHKNYNGWIHNLSRDINAQLLSSMGS